MTLVSHWSSLRIKRARQSVYKFALPVVVETQEIVLQYLTSCWVLHTLGVTSRLPLLSELADYRMRDVLTLKCIKQPFKLQPASIKHDRTTDLVHILYCLTSCRPVQTVARLFLFLRIVWHCFPCMVIFGFLSLVGSVCERHASSALVISRSQWTAVTTYRSLSEL